MATGANATPLGKLHPSIGAKRGFDAGPGAGGNGLMPTPGPPGSFPSLQSYQPPMPNTSFAPPHQFNPGFPTQIQQQSAVGSGIMSNGKLAEHPLTLLASCRHAGTADNPPLNCSFTRNGVRSASFTS